MAQHSRSFYLDQVLFEFGDGEQHTGRDAVEGIAVVGGIGSGKSTGSGTTVFRSMISAGYGGLLLTAKPDDLAMVARHYLRTTGRDPRQDIVVLQPEDLPPGTLWPAELGEPHRFRINLLRYEFERGGGLTANVVDVLHAGMSSRESGAARDPFWDEALRELMLHGVDLSVMGTLLSEGRADVRLDDILDIITTAPESFAAAEADRFRRGRCYELIRRADEGRDRLPSARFKDLQQTANYWLRRFPGLAEETRSSIVATFTAKVSGLLRSPLRELFCSDTSDEVLPERALVADPGTGHPKVIVLNLPVKLYQGVGRFAQMIYKTVWQHAAERRVAMIDSGDSDWRPAFLWADEAQYFVTPQDAGFQQTARSAMVATVYLTQNLPNYYATIGEAATHSFLGNLQTKVFHANGDPTTNEWAERVFAREERPFLSSPLTKQGSPSESYSFSPVVPAIRFTELKKGGPSRHADRHGRVGAYIFQAGRQWRSTGAARHYHEFEQDLT